MKIGNAASTIRKDRSEDTLIPMTTVWGDEIIANMAASPSQYAPTVRSEYPRPQFVRSDYHCLNGLWDYRFEDKRTDTVIPGGSFKREGQILVPFSPESLLSRVNKFLDPNSYLWYQTYITFSQMELLGKMQLNKRCLLHFDAVDQEATVYVNGHELMTHQGGYLPFTIDITNEIEDAPVLLQVRVSDVTDTSYHSRGKQTLKRGGMFYTPQSGIWQPVWYEWVPENHMTDYHIEPDYDNARIRITVNSSAPFESIECIQTVGGNDVPNSSDLEVSATYGLEPSTGECTTQIEVHFADDRFRAWTQDTPFLYHFRLKCGEDEAFIYTAMRIYTMEKDSKGVKRFCLNHNPVFLHGILDQGYWPDGLMTAPSDAAMIFDIDLARRSGFNMIRKHIKIEPLRWYYHCDRSGMIVWQDMVNGGSTYNMLFTCYTPTVFPWLGRHTSDKHGLKRYGRNDRAGRDEWQRECVDTVLHLRSIPSISTWVPFNEGWGQFDSETAVKLIRSVDDSRSIDAASGWFDRGQGDYRSVHNYFRKLKVTPDQKRAFVISEYGGYACHVNDHTSVERTYGYKKYESLEELGLAVHGLFRDQLLPLEKMGLAGAVYTQLSDIEEEVNGIITYDRRVLKYDPSN